MVCISQEIIDNAITIQFANMIPEQFYGTYKRDFQRIVKQNLNVRLSDVEIINVQASMDTIEASNSHRPRRNAPRNDLDVLFAVRKSADRFYNRRSLKVCLESYMVVLYNDVQVEKENNSIKR